MARKHPDPRRAIFVDQYLIDFNGARAATAAGYKGSQKVQAHRLLECADIQALIRERLKAREQRTAIDQDWVVQRAAQVVQRCMQEVPVLDRDGNRVVVETPDGQIAPAYTFNASGAIQGLALLAKHTGGFVDRFKDETEHEDLTDEQLDQLIAEKIAALRTAGAPGGT